MSLSNIPDREFWFCASCPYRRNVKISDRGKLVSRYHCTFVRPFVRLRGRKGCSDIDRERMMRLEENAKVQEEDNPTNEL